MLILGKDFMDITADDILALERDGVTESKHLEFKLTLPGATNDDKKEFLADVVALVNAGGGSMIFGIDEARVGHEKTGRISSIPGVALVAPDSEVAKLTQCMRTGIAPPVNGVIVKPFPLPSGTFAVMVAIPQSYDAPHMVSHSKSNKFYNRDSSGKYLMDVSEIKGAFLSKSDAVQRALKWGSDRISTVTARSQAPVPLMGGPLMALHLIPLNSFFGDALLDAGDLAAKSKDLLPIGTSRPNYRYNTDGFLSYMKYDKTTTNAAAYVQAFRTGRLESVLVLTGGSEEKTLYCVGFEQDLRDRIIKYFIYLKALNVIPPILLTLTMLGFENYSFHIPSSQTWKYQYENDDNYIVENKIFAAARRVDSWDDLSVDYVIKPMFDTVWNAGGYPHSPNFDKEGKWVPINERR